MRSTALQAVFRSRTCSRPLRSLRLPSLFLQPRRRTLLCHIAFLHICCPQCRSHRIRKRKQNTSNRHQFQHDSCNTEATIRQSAHVPKSKVSELIPLDDDLPGVRGLILLDMLLSLCTIPLLQLKIPRMGRWPSAPPLQHHKHDCPNNRYEVQR